ncbi:MAG: translocation/assembly module TamB domain-containing protein [Prevotella sp.]
MGRKTLYTILAVIASPFVLFMLLAILLYCPPVQRWAVGLAAGYASEQMGMEVTVRDVRLRFPLDLKVNGVRAVKPNDTIPQRRDTIMNAGSIICEVQMRPLFKGQVNVDIMQMDSVAMNTATMIPDVRVKGFVGHALVTSHGIDLKQDTLLLDKVVMDDANLDICLADTAKEDTTQTKTPWKIRLMTLDVQRSRVMVHMPGDTINAEVDIDKVEVRDGYFDLYNAIYQIAAIDVRNIDVAYDNRFAVKQKGFDPNHISASRLNLGIDSLYLASPDIAMKIRSCNTTLWPDFRLPKPGKGVAALGETGDGGFRISSAVADVRMDSLSIHVRGLDVRTPWSAVKGWADLDMNTFDENSPGTMQAGIDMSIGKPDVAFFAGDMIPKEIMRQWPQKPATLCGELSGNMRRMVLRDVRADVPGLASAAVDATVLSLDKPESMMADARMRLTAAGGNGSVTGSAHFNAATMAYDARLSVNRLNINRFMPGYGMGRFTGSIDVKGRGYDPFSPSTVMTAKARVGAFRYSGYDLSGAMADVTLANGRARASIKAQDKILDGDIVLDALLSKKKIQATVGADIKNIDLYALRLTKIPLSIGACGHLDIDMDMKENYVVMGHVSDIRITDSASVFHPDDIELDIMTHPDTTHAVVDCGDFHLRMDAKGGVARLASLSETMTREINRQIAERVIDEMALRRKLPVADIYLSSGTDNTMARLAQRMGYQFASIYANVKTSPIEGINGTMALDTLKMEGLQLDAIRLDVTSDDDNTNYTLAVENGEKNPQYTFKALLAGEMKPNGTTMDLTIDDANGRRGIDLGLEAMMMPDGIRMAIADRKQILGYRAFTPNKDNHVTMTRDMRVSADVKLVADDGTGVQIYTDDENAAALQDITFSVHQLDIAGILSILPYTPSVTGVLDGDFHFVMEPDAMSISGDISTRDLVYEGCPMGNISTEIVYMPQQDGSHHVDGILLKDGREVAAIVGTYRFGTIDHIDAEVTLNDTPMDIINGFIPDQIIGFAGTGRGTLTVKGTVDAPVVNGEMYLGDAKLISLPYGVELEIDKAPVEIKDSKILFSDFAFYDSNKKPLTVNGYCDMQELSNMTVDLGVRGENILIINAKENRRSEAYGKAYVNFYSSIKGPVDHLAVRAKLDVLPSTNLYYILRDSPITTDNRLKELVRFTDFTQPQTPPTVLPTVDGIDVNLNISVMAGSHITCWMNTNHTNYLDITGSGDLRMRYAADKLSMTGRYTIAQGEMKYSLPVIPLKTFTISEDSYIEFAGDIMNPRLNITATEQNRATVAEDGQSRTVNFTCGVAISKTLQDMGLEFIISAPEDQQVNDALSRMSLEERGKLAVTMLTTGMYLADTNTAGVTMNSALSSFLQQEINNIAGAALKTLDLSIGLENNTRADGTMSMDYSFKFAKRFWNNRVSVAVGGKISTGTQNDGKTPSFFDNIEMQYRLSDTSNQYLRLFYKHDVYDYLEGYLDQYGAGYMWKRKLQNFKDIFSFSSGAAKKTVQDTIPADTIRR